METVSTRFSNASTRLHCIAYAKSNIFGEAFCWDDKYVFNSYMLLSIAQTEKFLKLLKEEEGIKGLLTMAQSGNIDIIAQVARGMANFAKCETREIMQGLL